MEEREPHLRAVERDLHRRRARSDLDRTPGRVGRKNLAALGDLAKILAVFQDGFERHVSDADRFAVLEGHALDHRNGGASVDARKMEHRPVIECQRLAALGRKHRLGKEGRVLVVADDVRRTGETHRAETLPVVRILRQRDRYARAVGPERGIRHHVRLELRHVGYARILASVTWARPHFVRRLRLQREVETLAAKSVGFLLRPHRSDARNISFGDAARIEQQLAAGGARRCGIQDAPDLVGSSVRHRHDAEAVERAPRDSRALLDLRTIVLSERARLPYGK